MARKLNCWEFHKCGRGPGGDRVTELGVCPASTERSCSGINNGKNGGRMCWAIAGTFSTGRVMGAFARELSCLNCDFLRFVCREENICSADSLTPHGLYYDKSRMFGRRRHMRIDVHFDMMLRPVKYASEIVGVTLDLSQDGFSFISENMDLLAETLIEFSIKRPDQDETAIVTGDLAWKRQVRDRCLAGIKIRSMEQNIKNNILEYTYNQWLKGVSFH